MESRNCSIPAPELIRSLMHYSHIVSFPVYFATLVILFREPSKLFKTYKYFIIVHLFLCIANESYVSFFMLPVTYLPLSMFRMTGWLADLGFSGLFQFYGLTQSTAMTVASILEMFYYRMQVTVVLHQKHFFVKFAKYQMYLARFLLMLHPIIGTVTFPPSVVIQGIVAMKIWKEHPTFPPEITCYSVIVPVFDNWVFWVQITIYVIQVAISVSGSVGPLIFIVNYIKKGFTLSKETAKLQKILVMSLFIQGGVHSFLIIIPTIFQLYAIFFEVHAYELAQLLLLCVAYHGFFSTCAMIIFTKPLRDKFFFCLKWTSRTRNEILHQSSNRFSTSAPN